MCPIAHVTHCPCAPSPKVPHLYLQYEPWYPFAHVPLPMCPIAHMSKKDVKLSKRCEVVKRCQVVKKMSKSQTHGLWRRFTKKINWHNEVHTYWCQFWRHIWWWSKTLKMCIESVFEQFWWPSYLMSKLTSICVNLIMWIYFFVNLLHSLCVWLFDIWHLFDFLTSFWHLLT